MAPEKKKKIENKIFLILIVDLHFQIEAQTCQYKMTTILIYMRERINERKEGKNTTYRCQNQIQTSLLLLLLIYNIYHNYHNYLLFEITDSATIEMRCNGDIDRTIILPLIRQKKT